MEVVSYNPEKHYPLLFKWYADRGRKGLPKDLPKNTMINNMVRDSRERGSSYNETKRVQGGG